MHDLLRRDDVGRLLQRIRGSEAHTQVLSGSLKLGRHRHPPKRAGCSPLIEPHAKPKCLYTSSPRQTPSMLPSPARDPALSSLPSSPSACLPSCLRARAHLRGAAVEGPLAEHQAQQVQQLVLDVLQKLRQRVGDLRARRAGGWRGGNDVMVRACAPYRKPATRICWAAHYVPALRPQRKKNPPSAHAHPAPDRTRPPTPQMLYPPTPPSAPPHHPGRTCVSACTSTSLTPVSTMASTSAAA